MYPYHVIFAVLFLCLFPVSATAQLPLKTLAEVRGTPHDEALKRLPVEVEGTVVMFDHTNVGPGPHGFALHDGTAGCWIGATGRFRHQDQMRPGTRVRVTGRTNGSTYFPDISNATVQILGQGDLPVPRRVIASELFSSKIDSEWVEVDAVVVGVEQGGNGFTVVLEIGGRIFKAAVPPVPDASERAAALMQRHVRLQAIVGTIKNAQRQLTGREFLVPSFDQFIPIGSAPERQSVPKRKIASLLQSDHEVEDLVRVRGVVTQQIDGGLFLSDDTGTVFVQESKKPSFLPGSELEVEGYAAVAPYRPIVRATEIESIGTADLPPPELLETVYVETRLHNKRVAIECEFLDQQHGKAETILHCRAGDRFFEAQIPSLELPKRDLKAGDQLRLTGIYEVTTTHPTPRIKWANGFRLLLSGPSAITLLRTASWWTFQRVLIVLFVVAAVLMGVFVWNALLRRRVAAQAKTIAAQLEEAVIKDERQRVARELHDTLEQELTGLSIQLGNIASVLDRNDQQAHRELSLARQMLSHSRDEARASIGDLRDSHMLEHNLAEAMRKSLVTAANNATAACRLEVDGDPQPLRGTTANHLLRIASEAVRNAVYHANAEQIETRLTYDSEGVHLEVVDDGVGFHADQPPPIGHFGLIGMRERATKIHADFSIQSSEDLGSKVRVRLPWSSPVARPRSQS